ncbi:nucleotidyl transferase AbiEii/AbiGii toxin family protein [candidate division CSSED10-310 bacterium]|uniref:Nucleotidyl transferase AbiEii/AbiGii toxin family protein n=1 Tax=candidate division CSSED10-310 bacterium TaxID=2855610 RepID=A0ABV6YXK7_UNCC1
MNEAILTMLKQYNCKSVDDYVSALREILQSLALLGLWRTKFFEHAAVYGGSALRILYGLDRFSEDLDFSLLKPTPGFAISNYFDGLQAEIESFGFRVQLEHKKRSRTIESAFLKTNTLEQLISIQVDSSITKNIPRGKILKIRLEIDIDPPGNFKTESKYLLQPVPFSIKTYVLPDLFAGKMHALLCRQWKTRVKGRDWFDLVWYISNHPQLHLVHLEQRMKQTGHLASDEFLTITLFFDRLVNTIETVDLEKAKRDIAPFIRDPASLQLWSKAFFKDIVSKIQIV